MKNATSSSVKLAVAVLLGIVVIASAGTLLLVSTNRVSNNSTALSNSWEPSAAYGSTWLHSWVAINDTVTSGHSYVSPWNGSSWGPSISLASPTGRPIGDVYLEWDSARKRFVFCAVDMAAAYPNIWYGFSNDSSGSSWTVRAAPALAATISYGWDYPSIGVDANGRIIIGAVQMPGNSAFYAAVSNDGGATFSAPVQIPTADSAGFARGPRGRVVATSGAFHVFIPVLQDVSPYLPVSVERYQSSDGKTWSVPSTLASFEAPLNSSPGTYCGAQGCYALYYAPLLDARGSTNGQWAVAFPVNNGGYNNIYLCTSDRGCGFVNATNNDQFLAGTAIGTRPATAQADYWCSYLTFHSSGTRSLPLAVQSAYLPAGGAAVVSTTSSNVDPSAWLVRGDRCVDNCYTAGDFAGIAASPSAIVSAPFVQRDAVKNNLFQAFFQMPSSTAYFSASPALGTYAVGASLQSLGQTLPAQSMGLDLRKVRGVLDQQALGLDRP